MCIVKNLGKNTEEKIDIALILTQRKLLLVYFTINKNSYFLKFGYTVQHLFSFFTF